MSAAHCAVKNTSSGLRPDAGYFLLLGQEKVTKENATPVSRTHSRVPCAACLTSAAVELARSAQGRPRAQTVLAETPRPSELLGATQGTQLRSARLRLLHPALIFLAKQKSPASGCNPDSVLFTYDPVYPKKG